MMYLDGHPDVIQWASEEFSIPYISPIDGKIHRYFPDFWVKKRNSGLEEVLVIEVKPRAQTKPPVPQKQRTKRYINEVRTWGINSAKWEAAHQFCQDRKWKFVIFDEYSLGVVNG